MRVNLLPPPRFTPLEIACAVFILLCVAIILWVELRGPLPYCIEIRPKATIPGQAYALGRLERKNGCELFPNSCRWSRSDERRNESRPHPSGVGPMTIVDLIGKLPVHSQKKYGSRPIHQIRWIAVHHTAGTITQTPEQIARIHVHKNDWPGIGYHALVDFQGVVYKCWPASTVSYCVKGANTRSLCVALIGDFSIHAPPSVQWWATIELVQVWQDAYTIPEVYGHREVPTDPPQSTECPGAKFNCDLFRKDLESSDS